jgi:hypothetical protein
MHGEIDLTRRTFAQNASDSIEVDSGSWRLVMAFESFFDFAFNSNVIHLLGGRSLHVIFVFGKLFELV